MLFWLQLYRCDRSYMKISYISPSIFNDSYYFCFLDRMSTQCFKASSKTGISSLLRSMFVLFLMILFGFCWIPSCRRLSIIDVLVLCKQFEELLILWNFIKVADCCNWIFISLCFFDKFVKAQHMLDSTHKSTWIKALFYWAKRIYGTNFAFNDQIKNIKKCLYCNSYSK